jgi:hypothetical protein
MHDVIFDCAANMTVCGSIENVLSDVYAAIDHAGDSKPRSGIREHLLRAVLRINDELLPSPMDEYIRKHSS